MTNNISQYVWKPEFVAPAEVGNHFCVNPYLYSFLVNILTQKDTPVAMADVGAGTCSLIREFMQGASYLPEFLSSDIQDVQTKVGKAFCLDPSDELMHLADNSPPDVEDRLTKIVHTCGEYDTLPLQTQELDIVLSRHMLMHLSQKETTHHFNEVRRVLKKDGAYLLTILNPEYEQKKMENNLEEGEAYLFPTGNGKVLQYYKSNEWTEMELKKHFHIKQKHACTPITDAFKETHARYYDTTCPMAYIYLLAPKSYE